MNAYSYRSIFRHLLVLTCLLALSACAGKGHTDRVTGPKKLYVDINLGISVTVGGNWTRHFVAPPLGGNGSYAVRWLLSAGDGDRPDSVIEIARLSDPAPQDINSAMALVKKQWPTFEATALDADADRIDLLGHTRRVNLLIRLIQLKGHTLQLTLITLPEHFDNLRPAFDRVSASLFPIPD